MAKDAWAADEEPYCRHDPVTREIKCFWRVRHDVAHSRKLALFRSCMRHELEGRHYRTGDAVRDTIEVREAFAAAAHGCRRTEEA
jgi:hypothetical protein